MDATLAQVNSIQRFPGRHVFTARVSCAVEEEDTNAFIAGVAEHPDGDGLSLLLMCSVQPPDEQDVSLGMDTYCLTDEQGITAYGCVETIKLTPTHLRLMLKPETEEFGWTRATVRLSLDEKSRDELSEGLRRVLTYGRPDAWPAAVDV
jgi:hypothetical protein